MSRAVTVRPVPRVRPQLLVGERGWTPGQYEQWLGETTRSLLLRTPAPGAGD